MAKIQLLGGAYVARSVIAGMQRSLNLYIQQTPVEQGEPSPAIHLPTPGMVPINTPTRVVDPAYHSTSDVECELLNLRPRALVAQVFPTSEMDATLQRTRDLSSFLFVDTTLIGVALNPLFKPLAEAAVPTSVVAGAQRRSRALVAESITDTSLLSASIGKALVAGGLGEALRSTSTVVGAVHKHGRVAEAVTPSSVVAATLRRRRRLLATLAMTSSVSATALSSRLQGHLTPTSTVVGSIHRGHALAANLNPRGVPTLTTRRVRPLRGALLPRSALSGSAKSPGRLVEGLAPLSAFFATLTPKTTQQYYTAVRNWFVAPNGNDPPTGQGTSVSPWKTLAGADASGKLAAGDVVNFAAGTYNLPGSQVLSRGGNTNSMIGFVVYYSTVLHGAKLVINSSNSDDVVHVNGNYLIFDGFEIDGGNAGVTTLGGARTIGSGLGFWGHHLIALNNKIHDCGGSGIQANFKDWYIMDGNECYANSCWNGNQTSGISIYEPTEIPYTPSAADIAATYRIQVINNVCHDNIILGGSGITSTNHTDGNGIIMDDFLLAQRNNSNTTPPGAATAYTHTSLCQRNTCYNNGGRGVHVFSSTKVLMDSNIAYNNVRDQGLTGTERGDICAVNSTNCTMSNNRGASTSLTTGFNPFCTAVLHARSTSITWTNNATYDPRTGARSFNIDDATVRSAFPGANPLGGPLP